MTQENPLGNQPNPQNPPPNQTPGSAVPAPSVPRKRKWVRRSLYIVGGLVVVLVILVLLIPTIAGMGFVRSIVVNKVNDNLNGHVQIANWSLGWTSGIKVDGIKVFDDQNRQILEIPHVSTQLSLIGAIKGTYALGDTVVEGLDFNAIRYPDGSTNFQRLAKSKPADAKAPAAPQNSSKTETSSGNSSPTKLPDVSGQLRLVQCRGTVENIGEDPKTGAEQHDMVKFTSIQGDVKIPGINQTITDSLQVVEDNGSPKPGTLNVSGQLAIAKDNVLLTPDQMSINQTVALGQIDLKGFAWAIPGATLAGITDGNIVATLAPGEGATLAGSIQSKGFKYGGAALQGDTYAADPLTITIPKTVATLAQANGQTTVKHIRIGQGSGDAITIAMVNTAHGQPSQSTIKLTADAAADALQNLADNKAPGGNGSVRAVVDLDLVPLAEMVPHVLKMIEGSKLDGGRLTDTFEIQLAPDKALITENLATSHISGEGAQHNKISIDPITLSLKTIDRGGNGKIPDLRDTELKLTTASDPNAGWAFADVTAPTLTALKGTIRADLQRAQAQLGQLMDTGTLKLGGTLETTLQSEGDLVGDIKPGQVAKNSIAINTKINNLVIDGMQGKAPVKEPLVSADLSANLERGADGAVQFVRDLKAKILTGNEAKPTITVTAGGNLDLSQKAGSQESIQSNIAADLPQVQNEFGGFLAFLSDNHVQITAGALNGTANITSNTNHQLTLASDLAITSLTTTSPHAKGLQNEQIRVVTDLRAADDFSSADLSKFDVTSSFLTASVSDGHLVLKQGTGKDAKPVATLDMIQKLAAKVDVPSMEKLQQVMDAFSAPPAAQPVAPAPQPAGRAGRSAPQSAAAEPAPQPTKLAGGSATLTLAINRQGDHLSLVPNLAVRNLVLRKPDHDAPVGNIDVTATEIALLPNPASAANSKATTQPSIMDEIRELKIGQLVAKLSGAELDVNGSIVDLGNTRTFQNLAADLNYDAPKLWQVLVPLMFDKDSQAKWKDAKVAGAYKKHINIAGSFPTTLPSGQQPIAKVIANGDIVVDHFEAQGLAIDKLVLPFNLADGVFSTTYAGKPAGQNIAAPASANSGTIDLGDIAVNMNGPHMLLNIPAGKKLFNNVDLDPAFAQMVGDWVNNPMFVTASEAAGQMFFVINKCENLPMDDTVSLPVATNTGLFDANIKVNKIHLGNEVFQKVSDGLAAAKLFGGQTLNVKSLQGDISKWHVTVSHGITHQDMAMSFGESGRPLNLSGDVVMQTRQMNMVLDMPWDFFGLKNNKSVASLASGGLSIPITGPVTNPQLDMSKAIQKNLVENGPQNILQGILGQNKDKNAPATSQPDKKEDPLGALQDLFNQNKKDKEKKK